MSLETTIASLVAAANALTNEVSGKIADINKKVLAATDAVPALVRALSTQNYYIDAVDGDDANAGTLAKPLKTAAAASAKAVSGSVVTLAFKARQNHTVNFYLASGRFVITSYGHTDIKDPNDRPTLRAALGNVDDLGYQTMAGPAVSSGQMYMTGVNLICDVDTNLPLATNSSFIRYLNSHMSIMMYWCDITLGNIPFAAMYTGYSARDIFLASVNIKAKAGYEASAKMLLNRNQTNPAVRFEAHAVSLSGITGGWAQLMPAKSGDNYLTNLAL
ncbi:hypothetical protein QSV36_03605 [Pseudomonas sp. BCRC 81390]|uniref:hypothetical protein n=1 Tax=Pseudomonas sp. BCRC 81390 TaxID=3054778 RepID=UPI0025963E22|nr:hypothetical protein [Pseudomonas sp. BCRC 81390]MDM3884684.1 hypothetical protein [Pseudomonas sp. BCRC 81390]